MINELWKGIFKQNPIFVLVLGLCPALAVTTSVTNALGMGLATTAVLILTNVIISIFKGIIPDKIRIPCYIVLIAFVATVIDLMLTSYFPELHSGIGLFIKLIVVNCIVLGRAEAFAAKNGVVASTLDGIGMGLGFTFSLCLIAAIREILGANKFLGLTVFPGWEPLGIMILPTGAFFTVGFILGLINYVRLRKNS